MSEMRTCPLAVRSFRAGIKLTKPAASLEGANSEPACPFQRRYRLASNYSMSCSVRLAQVPVLRDTWSMESCIRSCRHWICFSLLAFLFVLPRAVEACGWDSDTVWVDARYMKDVLAVMVGRFPRNPPLYYEMRLERMKKELAAHPENLAAYDDAAVACDRLERQDEAIAFLDKKKAQLDGLPDSDASKKEHLYRYFSNL